MKEVICRLQMEWNTDIGSPDAPWRLIGFPEGVEKGVFAGSVHALPEALMLVGGHLPLGGGLVHGFLFEEHLGVGCEEGAEEITVDDHESAVDVIARDAFFVKADRLVALEDEFSKAGCGMDGGDGDGAFSGAVFSEEPGYIDVGDAVSVGQEKFGVGRQQVFGCTPDASARRGLGAGVDELNLPAKSCEGLCVFPEVDLKGFFEIAETENEAPASEGSVPLHDVPDDRIVPNLDHRFRRQLGDVTEARALATAENHDRGHFRRFLRSSSFHADRLSGEMVSCDIL